MSDENTFVRSAPVVMLSLSTQTVAAIALAAAILYAATVNLFQQFLTQCPSTTPVTSQESVRGR